jgi:electron transfer flavoprotein beta subunit
VRIVVPVKQVAVVDEDFELSGDGARVDPDYLEWSLNEWDDYSLEVALQLAEADGSGEVVVVTVGDEEATEGLLTCLAKGAHRGVRIWQPELDGADALAVARVLAAAVERESPDLVLCGVQSSDAVNSATGIALAAHLDLPHVAVVRAIERAADGGGLTVERELEGGLVEIVRIGLPALLTVQTGINEPRYANLRAIKQAREKPLEVLELDELGLRPDDVQAASGARLRRLAAPQEGEGAEMLEGSAADVARRIVEIVQDRLSA